MLININEAEYGQGNLEFLLLHLEKKYKRSEIWQGYIYFLS